MEPVIRQTGPGDLDAWADLRHALWPEGSAAEHRVELEEALSEHDENALNLVALADGAVVGFAEASPRRDYVNGCDASPVAFVEGIYVAPAYRATGVARALCRVVEQWAMSLGCAELASDALLDNVASHAFHQAIGFEETERVVYFRKILSPSRP